ncbi:MAG: tetratricopeptide repeat protein [Verrucomicrobiales bacterium]|nr:tetratricopeptide repeat protein [Verrucomicrobiales bacterium]
MRGDVPLLYQELERAPEDWSVRLRLIEAAVDSGNDAEAKRLVRESPGSDPLPGELQERIHALLTRQVNAAGTLIDLR